jgi:(p)ppGpp synthase/HD superfamily hydrolase
MTELRTFGPYRRWDELRAELVGRLPAATVAALDRAVGFAVERHGEQRRPAGEPYVEHLLETVDILVDGAGVTDESVLVAAVLHDVVEDTGTSLDEVREEFGADVAGLVAWVTKPDPEPGESADAARLRYLRSLGGAPERATWLKLADRISNIQRLETHPRPAKRASYRDETVTHVLPLAAGRPWYEDWYAVWREKHR